MSFGKIDAIYREKTLPVEAVSLYSNINSKALDAGTVENPFKGSGNLGLFMGSGYDFTTGNQKFGYNNTIGYKVDPNDNVLKEINSTHEWVA